MKVLFFALCISISISCASDEPEIRPAPPSLSSKVPSFRGLRFLLNDRKTMGHPVPPSSPKSPLLAEDPFKSPVKRALKRPEEDPLEMIPSSREVAPRKTSASPLDHGKPPLYKSPSHQAADQKKISLPPASPSAKPTPPFRPAIPKLDLDRLEQPDYGLDDLPSKFEL